MADAPSGRVGIQAARKATAAFIPTRQAIFTVEISTERDEGLAEAQLRRHLDEIARRRERESDLGRKLIEGSARRMTLAGGSETTFLRIDQS